MNFRTLATAAITLFLSCSGAVTYAQETQPLLVQETADPLPSSPMKIAIMGALPQEISLLQERLEGREDKSIGRLQFSTGRLMGHDVVIALSGIGKVAAATTASLLVQKFECTHLIFTGVAGSASPQVRVGDVVISSGLVQHDYDASPILPPLHLDQLGSDLLFPDTALRDQALEAAAQALANSPVTKEVLAPFGIDHPRVISGVIASGDRFVNSSTLLSEIRTRVLNGSASDLACVEMEGASVAQVCHLLEVPFLVIRTISDQADAEAHIDFLSFVDRVASRYSADIVVNLLSQL